MDLIRKFSNKYERLIVFVSCLIFICANEKGAVDLIKYINFSNFSLKIACLVDSLLAALRKEIKIINILNLY